MEAGERWMLNDVAGKPIRAWDSRGHAFRTEYDALRRPLRQFVRGHDAQDPTAELLFDRTVYGEGEPGDVAEQPARRGWFSVFDAAGVVTSERLRLQGQPAARPPASWRRSTETHPDWSGEPRRSRPSSSTASTTLRRAQPPGRPSPRRTAASTRPTYNEANLLERVDVNLRGAAEATTSSSPTSTTTPRASATLIDYGNGVRTDVRLRPARPSA